MSWCPAMTWAMCGGSPLMIASVMKIRRKSCGVKCSGRPLASVRPVPASAAVSRLRMVPLAILRISAAHLRWNRNGDGPSHAHSCRSYDGRQHVGQLRADDQEPLGIGFGRGDLQQRHQLAGGGKPVADQAVVGYLQQFLDADAFSWCPQPVA